MTRDQKIAEIATDLIRQSSMKQNQWRATSIGLMHAEPAIPLTLEDGEHPIVSSSFPEGDWYVWTSRRLVAVCEGAHYEADSESITRAEFGMFKGPPGLLTSTSGPIHTLIATLYSNRGIAARIRYETGFAAMGPIQCLKYWELKHPVLNKLMTPTEQAAYRLQKNHDTSR